MALEANPLSNTMPGPEEESSSLLLDMGKAFAAGATDLAAQGAGVLADIQQPTEMDGVTPRDSQPREAMRATQNLLNEVTRTIDENIAPKNRAAGEAEIFPAAEGTQAFTQAPIRSTAMKVARMAPMLLGAFLLPQGWAGVAMGSTFFGAQGAAQQLNESRKRIMEMSDEELQKISAPYRDMRKDQDEAAAREALIAAQNDLTTLLIAGGSQAVGGGALSHALKGQAAKSMLKSAGVGALEGVLGGAAMGAGMETASQRGEVKTGIRNDFDPTLIALKALNAGAEVGAIGTAFGAAAGARRRGSNKAVEDLGPDQAQTDALKQEDGVDTSARADEVVDATAAATEVPPAGRGTLAEQIAAERAAQAQAAEVQAAPVPPPPADTMVAPRAPVDAAGRTAVPLAETPLETPAAPAARMPSPEPTPVAARPGAMIPPPPTDSMLAPGRSRRTERTAVPLEEPPVTTRLDPDEVIEVTSRMPQKAARAPEAAPQIDPTLAALNEATAKFAIPEAPVTSEGKPAAVLVKAEPGKPRVFNTPNPELEARRAAREAKIAADKLRAEETAARRDRRTRNEVQPNEERASKVIKDTHPEDAEGLARFHEEETAALGGQPTTDRAREALLARARKVVALAEDAGVSIPSRTTWSKDISDRNPTPYTTRLIELVKFQRLVQTAAKIPDVKTREKAMQKLFADHVSTERALRQGDLATAAERRLEANDRLTAKAEQGREKAKRAQKAKGEGNKDDGDTDALETLIREQEADRDADAAGPRRHEQEEPSYEIDELQARVDRDAREGKDIPGHAEYERHSTVRDELQRLSDDFANYKEPRVKAQADLTRRIIAKIIDKVGDNPIVYVGDGVFQRRTGTNDQNVMGVFQGYKGRTLVDGTRGDILIRDNIVGTAEEPHAVIHESVHAALKHAIEADTAVQRDFDQLADAVLRKHGAVAAREYGIRTKDPQEFVAEALSNPRFQRLLADTKAPADIVKLYDMKPGASLWDAFVQRIAEFFGLRKADISVLDAVLRISDELFEYQPPNSLKTLHELRAATEARHQSALIRDTIAERAGELRDAAPFVPASIRTKFRSLGYKLATFDQLAQMGRRFFGEDAPADKLSRLIAKMNVEKDRIVNAVDRKVVADMSRLERKYAGTGQWDRFSALLLDETMAGAFADRPLDQQKHLGKDNMAGWQAKALHKDLAARYDALPQDLKDMRAQAHKFFRERQNEMSLARLKNIVRAINDGVPDDALATKIYEGKLDDAEKAVLERDAVMKAIRDGKALSKINGPYIPLMRRGEHVVSGRYEITQPGNARRLEGASDKGVTFEFKTRAEAQKFAEAQDLHVTKVERAYTDANGERWAVDEDGTRFKLSKDDAKWGQAEERYRVTVQDRHLEFFENETKARQRWAELKQAGLKMDGLQPRRWEPGGANASFMSDQFNRALNSLRQRNGFKELDKSSQRELITHLQEASLAALGSTRAQSRRLPRTYVAGASSDLMGNTAQYSSTSAGYVSRLKFQPQIDAQLKALTDYADAYKYEASNRTYPRGQLLREMKARVYSQGEPEAIGFWGKAGSRLLQLSFLDKLASPAFHIINSVEPWTVSMPVLAGRFGVGRTMSALSMAYRDIGAGSAVGAGARDTGRAFRSDQGLTDYVKRFSDRLKKAPDGKHLNQMLEGLYDVGLLARDAGMELGRMSTPNGPKLGRALDRADLMARQMGTAIESINRTVTAIAAYRLEFQRSKDHAKAADFAREKVVDTMGDYSGWNAPPIFNHPIGRLALQFKKYSQKTYYLLGKTAAAAFRGDKEAMKAFAGIMATHMSVAGVLGLPLEAVKAGLLAANLAGLTTSDYSDFEQWVRGVAARNLGVAGGQIATRGLPRYLGIDTSSRMGLESLAMPMGSPKSMKAGDLLEYAAGAFAGAPLSMIAEYPAGMQALWEGNVVEAARVLLPLKMVADSVQAYQRATEGKRTVGGRQSLDPYSLGEAVTKAIGFTPGRDAETGEMRAAISGDQRKLREERTKLVTKWVTATPAEKTAIWRQVQQWNAGQPESNRVTMADLTRAQQRRKAEQGKPEGAHGLRTTKRDSFLRDQQAYYNVQ